MAQAALIYNLTALRDTSEESGQQIAEKRFRLGAGMISFTPGFLRHRETV